MAAIKMHGAANRASQNEVDVYLSGLYPYAEVDNNPLAWWKVSVHDFVRINTHSLACSTR